MPSCSQITGRIADTVLGSRFGSGDRHALDGIVDSPVSQDLAFWDVSVWDGRSGALQPGRCVVIRDGLVSEIVDASRSVPAGIRVIDASGQTLIPGLIDAHVHLMFDSGPDLLTRGPRLMREWLDLTRGYPESRGPIVRRAQLKLKSGVTTMRVLGDGYYSLAFRDDVAAWDVVGPRVLTAGLHVNGPAGYVTGGLASRLGPAERAECALELTSLDEIESRLGDHISRGVDVVKIATTHGNLGMADAEPDLPEDWVREIVRVSHEHGLKVTAHSYGTEGDWAAIRGGVDGIEHLVNVPHELPDEMIEAIAVRGIWVTPTLAGSAYSVMTLLRDPDLLHRDDGLVTNVAAGVRRNLYLVLRLLRLPGVARILLRHPDPFGQLESWYEHSLTNTQKLYAGGVNLAFGTDTPFAFGNFHHSVMNEARALRCAGVPNEAILRMATVGSATALGIGDRVGTLQPGMRADCVLLDGDPLANIEALRNVNLVAKEGRVVYQPMRQLERESVLTGQVGRHTELTEAPARPRCPDARQARLAASSSDSPAAWPPAC
jgi:imidazolonepropionase-like amidohydrolase